MKVLILTDHSKHSVHNSVYNLANEIQARSEVDQVSIASRGDYRNNGFFSEKTSGLYMATIQDKVEFPIDAWLQGSGSLHEIGDFDAIFLRLPRPIAPSFFTFLQKIFPEDKIINRPSGIVKTSNKSYLTSFDKYVVPVALCNDFTDILDFHESYDCVLKPLEEYGGKGILKIEKGQVYDGNQIYTMTEFEHMYHQQPQPYLAMQYLHNVKNGDKRIVVVNGIILTSSLRLPAEGHWLCNVAQGGRDVAAQPTKREEEIVEYLNPFMAAQGIFYYGLDTLEDDNGERVISEINTLSIGGIAPAELGDNKNLSKIFAEQFVHYLSNSTP